MALPSRHLSGAFMRWEAGGGWWELHGAGGRVALSPLSSQRKCNAGLHQALIWTMCTMSFPSATCDWLEPSAWLPCRMSARSSWPAVPPRCAGGPANHRPDLPPHRSWHCIFCRLQQLHCVTGSEGLPHFVQKLCAFRSQRNRQPAIMADPAAPSGSQQPAEGAGDQ